MPSLVALICVSRRSARVLPWLVVAAVLSMSSSEALAVDSLDSLGWDYRVLIGRSGDPEPALSALADAAPELADRDLLYFLLSGDARYSNAPTPPGGALWDEVQRLVEKDGFVLIGRDGSVKARYDRLDLDAVFALIDTMPMRVQEMRARESE